MASITCICKSRFSRGCEKRWARTGSLGNLHIHSKEFAQDAESAICTDFGINRPLFYTPFACFGRSRPPDTPALKASTCTNAYYCGGNMPASMAMRGLGRCANVPEPSPQTSPTARFHTAATAASLRAAPCAHMRAQLSASEPRLVPVHEPRGRTRAEERAARHLTLHAAAGAAQAPRAMAAGHLRGSGRAARTSP